MPQADAPVAGMLQVMKVWALYNPAMTFLRASMGTVLVLWVGGRQVLEETSPWADCEISGIWRCWYDRCGRPYHVESISAARAAGERVLDVMDAPRNVRLLPLHTASGTRVAEQWSMWKPWRSTRAGRRAHTASRSRRPPGSGWRW